MTVQILVITKQQGMLIFSHSKDPHLVIHKIRDYSGETVTES